MMHEDPIPEPQRFPCRRAERKRGLTKLGTGALSALFVLLIAIAPSDAAQSGPADTWQIAWDLYLWAPSVSGETATGEDLSLSFTDLAKHLDMGFMSAVGARKERWSVSGDVLYLDLGEEDEFAGNLVGNPINATVDVGLTGWVVTVAGGYEVVPGDRAMLDFIFGFRYLSLDAELDFDIGSADAHFSGSGDAWDPIVGLRGRVGFAVNWYFSYHVDAGTGDTDLTWQGLFNFGYRWKPADIVFGYRYLSWDFADNDPGGEVFNDVAFTGPYLGARIKF